MKRILILCLLFASSQSFAQSKAVQNLTERTYLLSHTVFGTKDSLTLEDLFAREASYGHSGGKIETREEAIRNISRNRSAYTDTSVSNLKVYLHGETAVVRYQFNATETSREGKVTPLHFSMVLVWVKEKSKWRLFARQAAKTS